MQKAWHPRTWYTLVQRSSNPPKGWPLHVGLFSKRLTKRVHMCEYVYVYVRVCACVGAYMCVCQKQPCAVCRMIIPATKPMTTPNSVCRVSPYVSWHSVKYNQQIDCCRETIRFQSLHGHPFFFCVYKKNKGIKYVSTSQYIYLARLAIGNEAVIVGNLRTQTSQKK